MLPPPQERKDWVGAYLVYMWFEFLGDLRPGRSSLDRVISQKVSDIRGYLLLNLGGLGDNQRFFQTLGGTIVGLA